MKTHSGYESRKKDVKDINTDIKGISSNLIRLGLLLKVSYTKRIQEKHTLIVASYRTTRLCSRVVFFILVCDSFKYSTKGVKKFPQF